MQVVLAVGGCGSARRLPLVARAPWFVSTTTTSPAAASSPPATATTEERREMLER